MAKTVTTDIFRMTHDYFLVYLPKQRNASKHTIRAYQNAVEQFVSFAAERKDTPLWNLTFEMIDSAVLTEYLDSIEKNGGSVSTRNQRLKGIRAFYHYSAMMKPAYMNYRAEIYKVPFKNEPKELVVDYLREDAVKCLLGYPDTQTEKGIRDSFLLTFMYDSAARVQEVCNVRIQDIRIGKTPTVILHGKGDKTRTVPLMKKTMEHYERYRGVFHPNENAYSDRPLFYTIRSGQERAMNESTIRKIIGKYGNRLKTEFPEIRGTIHPHLLRHSRAMHLYQHGMDLILISQWLGHANLETTLIYAHADTEQKRKAIERATQNNNLLKEQLDSGRYTVTDETTLRRLYGLK